MTLPMAQAVSSDMPIRFLDRPGRPRIAYRQEIHLQGAATDAGPGAATLVFLPGYASDMAGSKATAVAAWARANGHGWLLFDYAGCGDSGGDFADQSLADWRDDALAIIRARTQGPLILIGSSMGGWLMLLVARALIDADGADRVAALVGIAAAPDFTDWGFTDAEKAALARDGRLEQPSPYGDAPTLTTRRFWESGEANHVLDAPIALGCPVRLLHGQRDPDVPWRIALALADRLCSDDVQLILVKDGDHRLSRPTDIALLLATLAALMAPSSFPLEGSSS